jgi:DtxR family Mn-dependent transcriptional regulator
LEDEPPTVFARIAAAGLYPGQTIWVLEADARRIVLSDGRETHTLAPVVGANIFVAPLEEGEALTAGERLTCLQRGQRAIVRGLDRSLQGYTRRRLLDLGLTPGAEITAEMSGIFRDPVAYRVRGSLIALRRDQAEHVLIDRGAKENRHHD